MVEYAATHVVEDASGARFRLYEYRGSRFLRPVRKFMLDTGEPVKRVDFDHYVIAASGEPLMRVEEHAKEIFRHAE
jgi:hypothetical protein